MMRLANRSVCLLVIGAVLCVLSLPLAQTSFARSARENSRMVENRAKRDRLLKRVKELKAEKSELNAVISSLDDQLETTEEQIAKIKTQREAEVKRRKQLEARKLELEQQLVDNQSQLAERARAIYMQGEYSYLDLLFQSVNFGELIDRMFFIQAIFERDEKLINGTIESKQHLQSQQAAVVQKIAEIDQIDRKLKSELDTLEDQKGDKELDMQAMNEDVELAIRQVRELEAENKRIAAQLKARSRSASAYRGKAWPGKVPPPCPGSITSGFGMRFHPILHYNRMHTGLDISAPKGTPIRAVWDGRVYFAGTMGGYGKCVIVEHSGGKSTLYGHMSRICCAAGDKVEQGTKIGEVGSTGFSTGNHCHFEIRKNGDPVDPIGELK